jgi:hypothetical protein
MSLCPPPTSHRPPPTCWRPAPASCAARPTAGRRARPDRIAFAEAHQAFQTCVEGLREKGVTRDLEFDDAARVFGLVFAIENLFGNLGDFEERIEETVGQRD